MAIAVALHPNAAPHEACCAPAWPLAVQPRRLNRPWMKQSRRGIPSPGEPFEPRVNAPVVTCQTWRSPDLKRLRLVAGMFFVVVSVFSSPIWDVVSQFDGQKRSGAA